MGREGSGETYDLQLDCLAVELDGSDFLVRGVSTSPLPLPLTTCLSMLWKAAVARQGKLTKSTPIVEM